MYINKKLIHETLTFPNRMSCGIIRNTVEDGITNPTPADVPAIARKERKKHEACKTNKSN